MIFKDKAALTGHAACFIAYAIFGVNIIVCKDLTTSGTLSPLSLFTLRSIGAGLLFWLISLFMPAEKIDSKDYIKIFAASLLGFFITQITFLMAIPDITPTDCSIMSSLSPIYTMFIAAVAIKEPITWKKAGGVALSFAGIFYLIMTSVTTTNGVEITKPIGIILMIANALSFSLYLGIFKPLISKYRVVTFMKWIFLFSTVMSLPFAMPELIEVNYSAIPPKFFAELSFLIIFATFVSYFLIPLGQKHIRPTLVSMYSYVQPIIAIVISISIGMEVLTWEKALAAITVFLGVYIVSRSRTLSR